MKKIIVTLIVLVALQINAQKVFNPSLRTGLNISTLTGMNADARTSYFVSFGAEIKFKRVYSMQPEIYFSNQGVSNVRVFDTNTNTFKNDDFHTSYFGTAFMNRFTFKNRFIVEVGPFLDFLLEPHKYSYAEFDLGAMIGFGLKLNDQIEVGFRLKVSPFIDAFDSDNISSGSYYENGYYYYDDNSHSINANIVYQFGVTYKF
jgi:Outer membrane protein beta-barrel domain